MDIQTLAWSCRSIAGGVEDGRGGRREGTNPHPKLLVHPVPSAGMRRRGAESRIP